MRFAGDELVSLLELCPALASLMIETAPPTSSANGLAEMAAAVEGEVETLAEA